jgi:hypothetical protein
MDKAGSAREDVAVQGSHRAPMGIERARGEDTLTFIGHCYDDDDDVRRRAYLAGVDLGAKCEAVTAASKDAEIERLTEQLRGAVGVRNHFREALRVIAANEHGDPADRNLARAALAHPGGGQ